MSNPSSNIGERLAVLETEHLNIISRINDLNKDLKAALEALTEEVRKSNVVTDIALLKSQIGDIVKRQEQLSKTQSEIKSYVDSLKGKLVILGAAAAAIITMIIKFTSILFR